METNDLQVLAKQAQDKLFADIYVPAFLNKCAAHGITFSSEEDVRSALENAAVLKQAQAKDEATKSIHKVAAAALGNTRTSQASNVNEIVKLAGTLNLDADALAAAEFIGTMSNQ